jgi:hypothetical protein
MKSSVAEAIIDHGKRDEPDCRQRGTSRTHSRALLALTVVGLCAAATWIAAAIVAAGHGFDITDEGFYLLSYRWWNVGQWNFTGAHYLYGPIFQALNYNIAALRLVRLGTIIATYLAFGWAFMSWLRLRRPAATASRLWEIAGVAAIVAAGGLLYGWLPRSPGYNDVALLGSLLTMALVCRAATCVDRGLPIPAWLPAASGAIAVAMLLAKWSAVVVIGLLAATFAVVGALRARQVARVAAWWLAGFVIVAGLMYLFIFPSTTAIAQIAVVNGWISSGGYSPASLFHHYAVTAAVSGYGTTAQYGLLFVVAVVAAVSRRPMAVRVAWGLGVVAISISVRRALVVGGLSGGTVNVARYLNVLLAAFVFTLLTAAGVVLRERSGRWGRRPGLSSLSRQGSRDWAVIGMLVVLPLAQAVGTSNPILVGGINGFAAWMAIIIVVVTGIEAAPAVARRLTIVVAVGTVVASACIATGGLLLNPYRTARQAAATSPVPGVRPFASIKIDPDKAAKYSSLRDRLAPWTEPPGRAMIAVDRLAGIILLLGGRPVGEPWTGDANPNRTAAGIRAECAQGKPWWGARLPILLFNRPLRDTELQALEACDLDFATAYRLLAPTDETMGLSVYVPTATAGTVR